MKTVAEKVQAGAILLDEKNPGWAWDLSLAMLDMQECTACVLGQLYGSFNTGLMQLDLKDPSDCIDFGFEVGMDEASYRDLETLWLEQVRDRRID